MGLSRQVGIVAVGRAASTASVFIVNALLARTWPLPSFGQFSAVWILGNTLVPVFLLGVPAALLYAYPRLQASADRRLLVAQASAVLVAAAVALTGLLWACATTLAGWLLTDPDAALSATQLLLPFLPYVFSLVAAGHVEAVLVAGGRPTWQAWLSVAGALAVTLCAWLAHAGGWGVAQTLAALSLVGMLRLGAAHVVLLAAEGWPRRWTSAGFGSFIAYAANIGLNDAVGSLSRAVDRFVVLAFLGAADLGLYHVGAIEVPVSLALAAVVTVLVPEVSRRSAAGRLDEVAELFRAAVGRLALFILPLFCYLFAFSAPLIALYLPAAFERSHEVFRVFLLALPLRCAVYNPILVGTGKARWALYGALGDLLANVTLSILFVRWLLAHEPSWALLGPAAATGLATYAQVGVLVFLLSRLLGQPWTAVLPWRRLGRVATASVAAALLSGWLARLLTSAPSAQLVIGAAIFGTVCLILMRCLGHGADWDELRRLGRALRRSEAAS